ncbi:MAG: LysM peptidoglycan-binding domain-containing M23 family metallopeptidase, partial [Anaerolineae bacterium]|nr:LysM peptidoglycan-binding domain-containing M23 family metallopeptidase [Anaerolineae bacterium]
MTYQTGLKEWAILNIRQCPRQYGFVYLRRWGWLLMLVYLLWSALPAQADSPTLDQNEPFVYTVQTGDTLIFIALKYNLNMADIALANHLRNPGLILPGQQLILPGVSSLPNPEAVERIGEQLHTVQPGETISSIANIYFATPDDVIALNHLPNPDLLQVGQTLKVPVIQPPASDPLTWPFTGVNLSEPTIIQGRTLVARVSLAAEATIVGDFEGQPVFFYQSNDTDHWGIVAIHALIKPNVYQLHLTATTPDGQIYSHAENVKIMEGPYDSEEILLDDNRAELLQTELIQEEREKLAALWSQITPRPLWDGPFWYPLEEQAPRVTSAFGTRRSYNDSSDITFHAGTDFGGGVGEPIYAPAGGIVVLAEPLMVRGNAVLIDHGMGLFSGYWHQSKVVVTPGQHVEPGDLIGYEGDT